MTNHPNLFK